MYAVLSTVLIIALIGILDDLLLLDQKIKAVLPIFAALPLVALRVGVTEMTFPGVGSIPLGPIYYLVLIPLAITGASNAMNMLAGFNGLEAGLGIIMCAAVAAASYMTGSSEALIISVAMLGALIGFMKYNWHPAKILIGDVGTLSIGAVIASTVIIGNIERVGIILIIPFFLELILKAKSRFKAESWHKVKKDKLVCENWCEVYGWGRLIMKLTGGVTEPRLVLTILGVEVVFAALAVWSVIG
ncbi:MAG: hypothetical protein GF334_10790 [Candidatus Altiarchaeales archaeon]|nr:hypothetical protein [Candidatus Altiarchaeales archaeon]